MKEVNPTEKELADEIAGASLIGVRRAWNADTIATGLNPSRLAGVLANANDGDIYDYLTLSEEIEEREPHYGSVLRTRKLAIEGLDRNVEAAGDDERSQQITEAVRELLNKPKFEDLVCGCTDALAKGFAAVEIIWDGFTPVDYKWRDPRYFAFSRDDAYTLKIRNEDNQAGAALPPYKFVVHYPKLKSGIPIRGGLARLAVLMYMCKTYTLADWMAYLELFGMPIRVGKYQNGASDVDKAVLRRAVANIGSDAAAIIPESMLVEFIETGAKGGETLYERNADWLDKQISKAILGQTMTTDDGSSRSQSEVHNEIRLDILESDAKKLSATINEQLVKPFVDFNFGVQAVYPCFEFHVPRPEDLGLLIDALDKLTDKGLKVGQRWVRDKFGIPDPQDDEELLVVSQNQDNLRDNTISGAQMSDKPELNALDRHDHHHNHHHSQPPSAIDVDDYNDFVNVTQQAIETLVTELQSANSFDEMMTLLNTAELNTSDITDALALAGIKAFGDGLENPRPASPLAGGEQPPLPSKGGEQNSLPPAKGRLRGV